MNYLARCQNNLDAFHIWLLLIIALVRAIESLKKKNGHECVAIFFFWGKLVFRTPFEKVFAIFFFFLSIICFGFILVYMWWVSSRRHWIGWNEFLRQSKVLHLPPFIMSLCTSVNGRGERVSGHRSAYIQFQSICHFYNIEKSAYSRANLPTNTHNCIFVVSYAWRCVSYADACSLVRSLFLFLFAAFYFVHRF